DPAVGRANVRNRAVGHQSHDMNGTRHRVGRVGWVSRVLQVAKAGGIPIEHLRLWPDVCPGRIANGGRSQPVLQGLQTRPELNRVLADDAGLAGEQFADPGTGSHGKSPPKAGWSASEDGIRGACFPSTLRTVGCDAKKLAEPRP